MYTENDLARRVVGVAFRIHSELGPGLLESVYETVLFHELKDAGLRVRRQVPVSIRYGGREYPDAFRADLIVEESLILEIKSVENLTPVHPKQLRTYLRLTGLKLGLLINFNTSVIKIGIRRVANGVADDPDFRADT